MSNAGVSSSRWSIWGPIIGALVSGTFVTISNKALYTTHTTGTCSIHSFEKPYFLTLCMFIGEAMCLVMYKGQQWYRNRELTHDIPATPVAVPVAVTHHPISSPHSSSSSSPHDTPDDTDHSDLEDDAERKPLMSSSYTSPSLRSPSPLSQSSSSSHSDDECLSLPITKPNPTVLIKVMKPPKYYYLIFSIFDLAGSAVGGVGLMYVEASIHQMLRGSMVVFTALAATFILKTHQTRHQWFAVMIVCTGLILVGTCDMLRTNYYTTHKSSIQHFTSSQTATGILLVMLASAINSIQNVYEERMMKGSATGIAYYVDPMELVGWEGIFGLMLSIGIMMPLVQVIPGSDCGSIENTHDTFRMISSSSLIITFLIGYIISIMFLNLTLLQIAQRLSSVHRNVLNSCRVILVWIVSVVLYYGLTHHQFGENVDYFSIIQFVGFIVLIGGSIMYGLAKSTSPTPVVTAPITSIIQHDMDHDDHMTSDGESILPPTTKSSSRSSLIARNVPVI